MNIRTIIHLLKLMKEIISMPNYSMPRLLTLQPMYLGIYDKPSAIDDMLSIIQRVSIQKDHLTLKIFLYQECCISIFYFCYPYCCCCCAWYHTKKHTRSKTSVLVCFGLVLSKLNT